VAIKKSKSLLALPSANAMLQRAADRIGDGILGFVGKVPDSSLRKSRDPAADSRAAISKAAAKASLAAGALALPAGPMGYMTILPELMTVWKIQAQLVADIGALHGKRSRLTQEEMLYCLYRHAAAQAVRDLVVRGGERLLVGSVSVQVIERVARTIGLQVARGAFAKSLSRWLPMIGAAGVAGYAYYDTAQVGATAVAMFSGQAAAKPATRPARKRAKPAA